MTSWLFSKDVPSYANINLLDLPADFGFTGEDKITVDNAVSVTQWKNGFRHGTQKVTTDGTVTDLWNYHYGLLHGPFKTCRLVDGEAKVQAEGVYHFGLRNGVYTDYDDGGNPLTRTTYRQDKRTGECIWYHGSGTIRTSALLKDGRVDTQDGYCLQYNREGQLVTECKIVNGYCRMKTFQGGKLYGASLFKDIPWVTNGIISWKPPRKSTADDSTKVGYEIVCSSPSNIQIVCHMPTSAKPVSIAFKPPQTDS